MQNPKVFLSYTWAASNTAEKHRNLQWIKFLAARLREDGVDVKIDQWELVPGDQLPHFMEKSVRENDFVLIICTPQYKHRSDNRIGGVGYEGDIMTGELLVTSNDRKFIPILYQGEPKNAMPSWLQGKYHIDFSTNDLLDSNYVDLLTTLYNQREKAPQLGKTPNHMVGKKVIATPEKDEPVKIKGILVDQVSHPKNDGTRGSALYRIPFELNHTPSAEWALLFVQAWNRPREFSLMHRPGIAALEGNKIILNGTTIEEVEQYHKKTLKIAVDMANETWLHYVAVKNKQQSDEAKRRDDHKRNVEESSRRISFED